MKNVLYAIETGINKCGEYNNCKKLKMSEFSRNRRPFSSMMLAIQENIKWNVIHLFKRRHFYTPHSKLRQIVNSRNKQTQ